MNVLCKSNIIPETVFSKTNPKNVKGTTKVRKIPLSNVQNSKPIQRIDYEEINKYLVKAERVNGRCAMIGFSAALAEEIVTHQPVMEQFMDNIGLAVTVMGLVIVGTASNPKDEGLLWGVFTRSAEVVNGRAAMVGLISLLISESVKNPQIPLF